MKGSLLHHPGTADVKLSVKSEQATAEGHFLTVSKRELLCPNCRPLLGFVGVVRTFGSFGDSEEDGKNVASAHNELTIGTEKFAGEAEYNL